MCAAVNTRSLFPPDASARGAAPRRRTCALPASRSFVLGATRRRLLSLGPAYTVIRRLLPLLFPIVIGFSGSGVRRAGLR